MIGADHLPDEIGGVAADLGHARTAVKHIAVRAFDGERQFHAADGIEREPIVEEPDERPERAACIIVLGLAEQQRRAALDIAKVHVVAERRAHDLSCRRRYRYDFGLRIVPFGDRMEAGIGAVADRRHDLGLGEDLGIGPDTDFEILRPHAFVDQQRLELHRRIGTGLELREIIAVQCLDLTAHRRCGGGIAARTLLDDPLQHRDRKRHTGRLDRLKIDRSDEPGLA